VAADDLSAPLGQSTNRKRRFVLPLAVPQAIAGALGLFLVVFVLWTISMDDPLGGEPMVIVAADPRPAGKTAEIAPWSGPAEAPRRYDGPAQGTPPGGRTVTIIDGSSGKRQEVVIPDGKPAPGGDERLLETSRHGPIPKIGADGARPADTYARPIKLAKADIPRVALVVTGLGIGANTTAEALAKLPRAVTLAFTPYGSDLERLAARARSDEHEVLLQIPMEPFDYPDNDPGPRTLLTSLGPEQNLDRLHWLMSRFQGYVGIANFMGARFTASEPALAPILREAAKRGLIFLDDATSSRSLAGQIAGAISLPFLKADVVLDAVQSPAEIDRALIRLEASARERGVAVGVAAAAPVTIDHIARWAKAVESRGVVLVPISTAANKAKSS
jgi:uncharacterized protein